MTTIVTVFVIALLMAGICILILILPYIFYFHIHQRKHCGHNMEYKGLKEDDEEGHYLFHCPHCGAWEQIPKEVFLKNFLYKDYDPLNEQL